MRFFSIAMALLPISIAVNSNFWPVHQPNAENPWVLGQPNIVYFEVGGGSGIDSFDIQLRHWNKTVMTGFIQLFLRVPMKRLPNGQKNFGGIMEVDLDEGTPTGEGFSLFFMNTLHGQVYQKSEKFSILPSSPSNFTEEAGLPTATVTATIDYAPNPTVGFAVTLDGVDPDAVATAGAAIAGQAGSGSGT